MISTQGERTAYRIALTENNSTEEEQQGDEPGELQLLIRDPLDSGRSKLP